MTGPLRLTAAVPYGTDDAMDAAAEFDRRAFETHPEMDSFVRPRIAGEFLDDGSEEGAVLVVRVADGLRARIPVRADDE